MKNGGKNKSVAFIILFSVYTYIYIYIYIYIYAYIFHIRILFLFKELFVCISLFSSFIPVSFVLVYSLLL